MSFTLSAEQITDLFDTRRRLMSLTYLGQVIEVKNRRARVQILGSEVQTGWLPFLKSNAKSFIQMEKDAKVLLFFPQGEIGHGVILGALDEEGNEGDNEDPFQTFPDGTTVQYGLKDGTFTLAVKDGPTLTITKDKKLKFTGDVEIGGTLKVAGDATLEGSAKVSKEVSAKDVKASGDVTATGEVTAGMVKLSIHSHANPEGGSVGTPV